MARIRGKAGTGPDIPLDPHLATGQLANLDMHPGLLRTERRLGSEVGNPMLPFHSVVGLATIDPVAIDTDAHAA